MFLHNFFLFKKLVFSSLQAFRMWIRFPLSFIRVSLSRKIVILSCLVDFLKQTQQTNSLPLLFFNGAWRNCLQSFSGEGSL